MQTFDFVRVSDPAQAVKLGMPQSFSGMSATSPMPLTRYVAGGTTLLNLMKLDVERPTHLVDINQLPFKQVESMPDGGLKIGALVRNADLANHALVKKTTPCCRWR